VSTSTPAASYTPIARSGVTPISPSDSGANVYVPPSSPVGTPETVTVTGASVPEAAAGSPIAAAAPPTTSAIARLDAAPPVADVSATRPSTTEAVAEVSCAFRTAATSSAGAAAGFAKSLAWMVTVWAAPPSTDTVNWSPGVSATGNAPFPTAVAAAAPK